MEQDPRARAADKDRAAVGKAVDKAAAAAAWAVRGLAGRADSAYARLAVIASLMSAPFPAFKKNVPNAGPP